MTFDTFSRELIQVPAGNVFVRRAGSGPGVLLLHGFPETSVVWRKIAPDHAKQFSADGRTMSRVARRAPVTS